MKQKHIVLCVLAGCLLAACSGKGYKSTSKGIIVKIARQQPADVRNVRVEVVGERILRVSATPGNRFSEKKSLAVIPPPCRTDFTVEERDGEVSVCTSQLRATVSKATGEVQFRDAAGRLILAEEAGGRSFTPITVDGTHAYTVRQVFRSAGSDEALYGLGQHQADEFNYKGKNEDLFQYNTKVSVPFIVSNKHYGILWDSYSRCRFGDARDYAQLGEVFRLYDSEGVAGALTGTYLSKDGQTKQVRREDSLYFEHLDRATHLEKVVNLPVDFPFKGSSVTYEGEIEPMESGTFRFQLYYAGYIKVYMDKELVVPERWRTAWNPNSYKFAVDMEAGRRVPLRIEWKPDGDVSYCGLRVLSPVPAEEQNKLAWWSEMQDEEDYYFIYGDTPDEIIGGYRTLTGKAPIVPKWAMGFWQSRERYKTQAEIVGTLKEFRRRHIPIDNIVQDWSYWPEEAWGSHEFDAARFPDPRGMVDSIHALHGRVMISVWPKFYAATEHFKEMDAQGWMYRQAIEDSLRDWIGPGYLGSFYDAYDEGARRLFWQQVEEHLYPLGFDAWWMDASEPNIRDCTDMAYRHALCGPTALGSSTQYFNAYALMNAEAIYDGQRGAEPDRRVFQLTRSGFAGLQRYAAATWSGDIATRWEDMKAQISAGLNYAMSGIPYWTMDIGGFCVEDRYVAAQQAFDQTGRENEDLKEWRELNARWYQFGAFCPLYRAHGQFPFREAWHIAPDDHPCYRSILYYTRLRYRLMPYVYSLAAMAYFDDYTLMRPLVMDFTDDKQVNDIGDQFLFGPSLMVAPVYVYGRRSRSMYFPSGCGWYDFYSGTYMQGGQTQEVPAPYERIPLYVREGAILPCGPEMEYSDEKPATEITLYVYGGRDGAFTLYEDEGVNYHYEKGQYALIPFIYRDAENVLEIGDRAGEFPGMLRQRTFRIVKVDKENPRPFAPDAEGIRVDYDGKARRVKL